MRETLDLLACGPVSVHERKWGLKQRDGTPKLDTKGKPVVRSSWVVQFRWRHPDGRVESIRMTSPVQTRRGALEWERNKRLALLGGQLAPNARQTSVRDAAETLLRTSATDIKASTPGRYCDGFRLHILPALGDKAISRVTDEDVDELKANLCAKLKPGTANGILRVLRRLLKWSEERKLLLKAMHSMCSACTLLARRPRSCLLDNSHQRAPSPAACIAGLP